MNPGAGDSSLDQPPPSSCLFSKMPTFIPPYFWRYMPATRALFPPPTITTSKLAYAIISSNLFCQLLSKHKKASYLNRRRLTGRVPRTPAEEIRDQLKVQSKDQLDHIYT